MSLMSQIGAYASNLSYGHGKNSTALTESLQQALEAARTQAARRVATDGTVTADAGVTISNAAAEAADKAKDFTALAGEVRAALDAQSADKTGSAPDLTGMSGRALAAVILNRAGDFTPAERAAARLELRHRERTEFSQAMVSGSAASAVEAYSRLLVSRYDAMSAEEREARAWTPGTRSGAGAFLDRRAADAV